MPVSCPIEKYEFLLKQFQCFKDHYNLEWTWHLFIDKVNERAVRKIWNIYTVGINLETQKDNHCDPSSIEFAYWNKAIVNVHSFHWLWRDKTHKPQIVKNRLTSSSPLFRSSLFESETFKWLVGWNEEISSTCEFLKTKHFEKAIDAVLWVPKWTSILGIFLIDLPKLD